MVIEFTDLEGSTVTVDSSKVMAVIRPSAITGPNPGAPARVVVGGMIFAVREKDARHVIEQLELAANTQK